MFESNIMLHVQHPVKVICKIELSVMKISTNQNVFYLATTDCCALDKYNELIYPNYLQNKRKRWFHWPIE